MHTVSARPGRAPSMLDALRRITAAVIFLTAISWSTPAPSLAYDGHWTLLTPTGTPPAARRDAAAIYDPVRDRLLMHATDGAMYEAGFTGTWTRLTSIPALTSSDFERAIYDPVGDRMIVVNSTLTVFALPLANPVAWSVIGATAGNPPARGFFSIAYDSARRRLWMFGGGPSGGIYNDLWYLPLDGSAGWTQLFPGGFGPPAVWGPTLIYDPVRDRLVAGLGATTSTYAVIGNLWALNLSGSPTWTLLPQIGDVPSSRLLAGAMYDSGDDGLLLFGGYPTATTQAFVYLFGAQRWLALDIPSTTPGSRWSTNLVLRTATSQAVLYGGFNGNGLLNDLWLLDRAPEPGPPMLTSVTPTGGPAGTEVTFFGSRLDSLTSVKFNGTSASILAREYRQATAVVPPGATTGPLVVTNRFGSATWSAGFFVGNRAEVTFVDPDSGRTGDVVQIHGRHFTGATQVRFGTAGAAPFAVQSDTLILAALDSAGTSGPVVITNPAGPGTGDFFFHRIEDNPRPLLYYVRDVRGDQGGKVQLSWRGSDYDRPARHTVTGYRVWRRGQPPASVTGPSALPPGWMAQAGSRDATTSPPVEYWEALATLPAAMLDGYAYVATTTRDSVEGDAAYHAFFVQAVTADPTAIYHSVVDSACSVDNLAPPAPAPFTVVYAAGANTLHWRGRELPDLRGYELHRGASATFVPSASTRIALVADTTWQDIAGPHFYKLAAVDVHGNRSLYAAVSPQSPVATLASFVRADRTAGHVLVTWYSNGNAGLVATVYRRTLASGWEVAGLAQADGDGYLRFEDTDASDDERYGYRLGITEPEVGEMLLGETWVDALQATFALLGIAPNPSRDGRVTLSFSLPASRGARVQLFDVAGREVARADLAGASASTSRVEFGSGTRLKAGVYLLRATSGDVRLTRRVVVLH